MQPHIPDWDVRRRGHLLPLKEGIFIPSTVNCKKAVNIVENAVNVEVVKTLEYRRSCCLICS